jgi:TonB family protein
MARSILTGSLFTLLFIVTGLLSSCSSSKSLADKQNYTEDDNQYRNKYDVVFDENEKSLRYGYNYIVSKVPEGYRVRVFHPEKKVMIEDKIYSTPSLTLLHGFYKSWWDDGSIREQGTYQFGRKHGIWLENEPGKGRSASGEYFNDRNEGLWTQLDSNAIVESVFEWKDGKRHGKFFLYDGAGQKTNEGLYRNDTLIGELFKQPVLTKPYLKSCNNELISDVFQCTDNVLTQYLYTELRYPAVARKNGIEGRAFAQWDVMEDGSVRNIRVPQALNDDIEAEVIGVFKKLPGWSPALRDGVPVARTVSMPINFSL